MSSPAVIQSVLEAPLARLKRLGLERPPQHTLGRYLRLLAEQGLLSRTAVESYLDVCERVVFGRAMVQLDQARCAADAIEHELDALPGDGELLAQTAAALYPPPPPAVAAEPDDDGDEPESPCPQPGESAEVPASPELEALTIGSLGRWRRAVVVSGLVVWSVLMVTAGYLGEELIDRGIGEIGYRFFGRPRYTRLEIVRRRAGENPHDLGAWRSWADAAARAGNETEAIVALQYLIARRPEDPRLLNRLAWLLLTADQAHARDPRQAIVLAERAYALSTAPNITDTLAEAAFQNGDAARAVRLEEQALAAVEGGDGFFRRQLARFRAGLEQQQR